jgi:hypothetical protein
MVYVRHFGAIVDHPSAQQVWQFDAPAWDRHFKFTFVRNPYARLASLYLMLNRNEPRITLSTFILSLVTGDGPFAKWSHLVETWPIYTIQDRIAVDFIGRQEDIDRDFRELCWTLGLPYLGLGNAKVAPKYNYRELYDDEARRSVAKVCERELEFFGYSFDE